MFAIQMDELSSKVRFGFSSLIAKYWHEANEK